MLHLDIKDLSDGPLKICSSRVIAASRKLFDECTDGDIACRVSEMSAYINHCDAMLRDPISVSVRLGYDMARSAAVIALERIKSDSMDNPLEVAVASCSVDTGATTLDSVVGVLGLSELTSIINNLPTPEEYCRFHTLCSYARNNLTVTEQRRAAEIYRNAGPDEYCTHIETKVREHLE